MKLKKLGWLVAAITASALLLASCGNLVGGTVKGPAIEGEIPISLKLGNVSEDGVFSRTLLPKELELADVDYYTLSGESQYASFGPENIEGADATALGAAGYVRSFTSTYWHLTLRAYQFKTGSTTADPSQDTLLLQGTADIDLSSSTATELTFSLSSYKVTTAGSYDIILNYKAAEWKADYALKYGLYDVQTGKTVGTESTIATATTITKDLKTDTAGEYIGDDGTSLYDDDTNFHATGNDVAPGSYIFGVTFYDKVTGGTEIGYYSDVILIEPAQTTKRAVALGSILGTAPAAPTDLKVQRIVGKETDGYYQARFTWKDNSSNEKYFKLVIKEYNSSATDATGYTPASPIDTAEEDGLVLDYTVYSQTDGDIRYEAGSLFAGNQELVLTLPTGRLFDAEIFAVNTLGDSDSDDGTAGNQGCSRVAATTGTTALANTLATTVAEVTEAKTKLDAYKEAKVEAYAIAGTVSESSDGSAAATNVDVAVRINLVQITYNLNGGTLKTSSTATADYTEQAVKTFVDYKIYKLDTDTSSTDPEKGKYMNIPLLDLSKIGTSPNFYCNDTITYNGNAGMYCQLVQKYGPNADDYFWWTNWQDATQVKQTYTDTYKDLTVIAGYAGNDITLKAEIAKFSEIPDDYVIANYGANSTSNYGVGNDGTNCKNQTGTNAIEATTEKFITIAVKIAKDGDKDTTKFKKFKLAIDGKELQEKSASQVTTYSGNKYIKFENVSTSSTTALQESGVHTVSVIGLLPNGKYCSNTFSVEVKR